MEIEAGQGETEGQSKGLWQRMCSWGKAGLMLGFLTISYSSSYSSIEGLHDSCLPLLLSFYVSLAEGININGPSGEESREETLQKSLPALLST